MDTSSPTAASRRTRRELLKLAPLAGAALLFSPRIRERTLQEALAFADRASAAAFSGSRLAPTYADRDVTPLDRSRPGTCGRCCSRRAT